MASNKRKIESTENDSNPIGFSLKIVKGEFPSQICLMLYNKAKNHPFMVGLPLMGNGSIIYKLFKWANDNNIIFNYNDNVDENIYLYGYSFIESEFRHLLVICNEEISQIAMQECKNQELNPYDKPEVKQEVKTEDKPEVKQEVKPEVKQEVKPEIKQEVKPEVKQEVKPEIKQEVKLEVKQEVKPEVKPEVKQDEEINYKCLEKEMKKFIICHESKKFSKPFFTTKLLHHFVNQILTKSKELNEEIYIEENKKLDGIETPNFFEEMLFSTLFGMI